jgi:hypothetical protein
VLQNGDLINGGTHLFPPSIATNRPITPADFIHYDVSFVATSPKMVLTLMDDTSYPYNLGAYGAMDNVVLRGPAPAGVPEPASWALMLVGVGMAGAGLRNRRRARRTLAA